MSRQFSIPLAVLGFVFIFTTCKSLLVTTGKYFEDDHSINTMSMLALELVKIDQKQARSILYIEQIPCPGERKDGWGSNLVMQNADLINEFQITIQSVTFSEQYNAKLSIKVTWNGTKATISKSWKPSSS